MLLLLPAVDCQCHLTDQKQIVYNTTNAGTGGHIAMPDPSESILYISLQSAANIAFGDTELAATKFGMMLQA